MNPRWGALVDPTHPGVYGFTHDLMGPGSTSGYFRGSRTHAGPDPWIHQVGCIGRHYTPPGRWIHPARVDPWINPPGGAHSAHTWGSMGSHLTWWALHYTPGIRAGPPGGPTLHPRVRGPTHDLVGSGSVDPPLTWWTQHHTPPRGSVAHP
jgi:hypothetical protein